jgi:hypothetical protein
MSDKTFHVTSEDVRKLESKDSKFHGGQTPKDSDASALKVCHTHNILYYFGGLKLTKTPATPF